jgi:glycosyltransferase involved in cell wall biosynthesis
MSYSIDRHRRPTDIVLDQSNPLARKTSKGLFFAWALSNFDVFHFFHGFSLLPRHVDLPLLRRARRHIVAHFCGGDVRNTEVLKQRNEGRGVIAPMQTAAQEALVRRWRAYASLVLVATPDLIELVPDSTWLPQMIDLREWDALTVHRGSPPNRAFRLVHVPSATFKKGTNFVVRAVESLRQRGVPIELRVITNGMNYRDVAAAVSTADAGIDQLLVGWYGTASIEMMASRLPTLCYVRDDLRSSYAADLPLVQCTPQTVEAKLGELIERSPEERQELGERGRKFVEGRHDIARVSEQLVRAYTSIG